MMDSPLSALSRAVKDLIEADEIAMRRACRVAGVEEIRFLAGRQSALLDVQDKIASIARDADLEDHL